MIYIVKSNIWFKSRKFLKEALGSYYTETNPSIILNFGGDYYGNDDKIVLNRNTSKMYDKVKMNKFLDKKRIRHPKTYYYPFHNIPDTRERCVLKEKFGSMSKGVSIKRFSDINPRLLSSNYFIQHYIPFEKEYRVVVDFLGVIGSKEKIPRGFGSCRIKNNATCSFRLRNIPKLDRFAVKITKKFKADFCGLDIGFINNHYYVIEINSACGIYSRYASVLANHMIGLLYR